MSKKPNRKFSDEIKSKAVEEYTSGIKSAAEVAHELGVAQGLLYQWKIQLENKRINGRVNELEAHGRSPSDARIIQQQEDEIAMYQKKIAEQAVIIDLLKKLPTSMKSVSVKSVSGSDEIALLLAQSRKRVRR